MLRSILRVDVQLLSAALVGLVTCLARAAAADSTPVVHVSAKDLADARTAPLNRKYDWSRVPDDEFVIAAPCGNLKLVPSPDAGGDTREWGAFTPEDRGRSCVFILSDARAQSRGHELKLVLAESDRVLVSVQVDGATRVEEVLYGPAPGTWFGMFHAENDIPRSDQNYTNGERLEIGRVYRSVGPLDHLTHSFSVKQISALIGLNMYTPTDISWPAIIEDDRPYAGWTYIGVSLTSDDWSTDEGGEAKWRGSLTWEASMGVLGDFLAGDIQAFVHYNVSNSPNPVGWDKDLHVRSVPALYLSGTLNRQVFLLGRYLEGVSFSQVELGNVFVRAHQGGMLRIGLFRAGAGPGRAMPTATATGLGSTSNGAGLSFDAFAFGRLGAALVLWNGTLQGGFRDDPHTVEPRRLVPTSELGAQLGLGRFFINFSHVWRGPEVHTLLGDPHGHDFSQAQVGWMAAPRDN